MLRTKGNFFRDVLNYNNYHGHENKMHVYINKILILELLIDSLYFKSIVFKNKYVHNVWVYILFKRKSSEIHKLFSELCFKMTFFFNIICLIVR